MTDTSTAEIAEAREDLEDELLPDECTVYRSTEEVSAGGNRTPNWKEIRTYPCAVEPYGGGATSRGAGGAGTTHPGERIDTRTEHIIVLPAEANVEVLDHLEINSATYEVLVLRRRGSWELLRRVEVKEHPGGS
jgi:hypothetical protein